MSKTTEKYGKPVFTARLATDWPAQPSDKLKKQWARLDEAAQNAFGKQYDALNEQQKSKLHYDLNIAKEKSRAKPTKAEFRPLTKIPTDSPRVG